MDARVSQEPLSPEKASGAYDDMSLRTKFLITIGLLSLLPVLFIVIHVTTGYDSLLRTELTSVSDPAARAATENGARALKTTTALLTILRWLSY